MKSTYKAFFQISQLSHCFTFIHNMSYRMNITVWLCMCTKVDHNKKKSLYTTTLWLLFLLHHNQKKNNNNTNMHAKRVYKVEGGWAFNHPHTSFVYLTVWMPLTWCDFFFSQFLYKKSIEEYIKGPTILFFLFFFILFLSFQSNNKNFIFI